MSEPPPQQRRWIDIAFDLRTAIGALLGTYGLLCLIWGLAFTSATDQHKTGGININLWAGIGMLLAATAFLAWALARPLQTRHHPETEQEPE